MFSGRGRNFSLPARPSSFAVDSDVYAVDSAMPSVDPEAVLAAQPSPVGVCTKCEALMRQKGRNCCSST
jgi:hypothetical protein